MTNLIDSQAVWNLRPEWIPGQVEHTRDNIICIEVKIPLRSPDGDTIKKVECDKSRFPKIMRGQTVLFSAILVPASNVVISEKDSDAKQQQRIGVDELRAAGQGKDRDEYNGAIRDFAKSHAIRLEHLITDVDKKIEELATKRADEKMQPERESVARAWKEHAADLEKYNENRQSLKVAFSALATEQAYWDKEQQQIQNARQDLEQYKREFEQAGGLELLELVRQSQTSESGDVETADLLRSENDEAPHPLIKSLGGYFQSQNYSIDDSLLLQALLCLCVADATGQFIVLTGPPGSGKTSLVQKLAQAIGAGSGVVPVRPAWIDATDLIGFYNPGMNRYQPTPFLDHVLQAKRYDDLNRLYLLVLDEMNLGRVENYAADFLSLLEKAREGDGNSELQLYSREIKNRFRAEQEKSDVSDNQKAEMKAHELLYPSRLPFPKGLVILGTINVDETTHLPSPKFLDRSLTIQVSGTKLPESLGKAPRRSGMVPKAQFSWVLSHETAQRCLDEGNKLTPAAQGTWELFMQWNMDYLKPLGVRLSHRLPQVYRCYMGAASVLKISNHQQVADTFVLSKILPLISFRNEDLSETSSTEQKRSVLERWCGDDETKRNFPGVHAALEAMLARSARPGMIVRYLE